MKKGIKINYKILFFILLFALIIVLAISFFAFINYQRELNKKYNLLYEEMNWLENNLSDYKVGSSNNNYSENKIFIYTNNLVIQNAIDERSFLSGYSIFPLIRYIDNSSSPINDTYRILLEGKLSFYEKEMGYESYFPVKNLVFKGASLKNNTLYISFDNKNALSELNEEIKKIIELELIKTGLQFEEVAEVIIQPEDIFKWIKDQFLS